MSKAVSLFRVYLMRVVYMRLFVGLGWPVWRGLLRHEGWSDPLQGVAISFWAALSALAGLGIRYPLKMLPLLLLQFCYKSIWLLAVWLPLRSVGQATGLLQPMLTGVVVDLIVIPWPYVFATYVRGRGERWRPHSVLARSAEANRSTVSIQSAD